MLLSIIIVNHDGRELLDKCLSSLFNNPPTCGFEVIVVDNGSSDGSQDLLETDYPTVKVMRLNCNLGFSKANNIGIKESQGDYILLLNNDTLVCPAALDRLLDFAKGRDKLGMVGPKLVNPDGTVQQSCYDFPTVTKNLAHLLNLTPVIKAVLRTKSARRVLSRFSKKDPACLLTADSVREVDYVKFACVLIPRAVFDRVGYLDENLFIYHEDCEFGYRIKESGLGAFIFPFAEIVHLGKGSSKPGDVKIFLHFFRGLLYLFRKHKEYATYVLFRITTAFGMMVRLLLLPFTGGRDLRIFSREKPREKLKHSFPLLKSAFKGYLTVLKEYLAG